MNVIFLAGGPWQKPFVKYLKNKGHFVAVVNPISTQTTDLADLHIKCDVNDLMEIGKYVQRLNPLFITSDQSDISTLAVAKLSEEWKLPGNSVSTIENLTNKFNIYQFAKQIGVPVPNTELIYSTEDICNYGIKHGFPIIVKPTDETNSRGVRKINSIEEITEEIFQECLKFSKSKQVIVQDFVSGQMVTLEGVCSGNKHKTIANSRKNDYFKPGINSDIQYPSNLPDSLMNRIVKDNDNYVESSGMKFGLTHSEYIVNDDNYYLIEIGGRGGGAGITDKIVPWVSGIESYDVIYQSLMGQTFDVQSLRPIRRNALLKYYLKEEVENCTQDKIDLIKNTSGVSDFQFDFIGQQYVKDYNDVRHSMGIYLANSENEINVISNLVKFILES